MKQLRVNALPPGPALVHQRAVQPPQRTHLQNMRRRDRRLRRPALPQQRAQQPRIGAVGLGAPLRPPQSRGLGRISQMRPRPAAVNSSTTNRYPVQPSTANSASPPGQCLPSQARSTFRVAGQI